VDRFGAPHEGVDERVRDVAEDRADDALEHVRPELPGKLELDPARGVCIDSGGVFALSVVKWALTP